MVRARDDHEEWVKSGEQGASYTVSIEPDLGWMTHSTIIIGIVAKGGILPALRCLFNEGLRRGGQF
jgi:hypothetical protein